MYENLGALDVVLTAADLRELGTSFARFTALGCPRSTWP